MTETELKENRYTIVKELLKATNYMTDKETDTVRQIRDKCYGRYKAGRKQ